MSGPSKKVNVCVELNYYFFNPLLIIFVTMSRSLAEHNLLVIVNYSMKLSCKFKLPSYTLSGNELGL